MGVELNIWNDEGNDSAQSWTWLWARFREEVTAQQQYNHLLAGKWLWVNLSQSSVRSGEAGYIAFAANWELDVAPPAERIIIFVILLLVPAINLSSKDSKPFASETWNRCVVLFGSANNARGRL